MLSKPQSVRSSKQKFRKAMIENSERKSSLATPPIDAANSAAFVPQGSPHVNSGSKLPYYPIKVGNKTVE